MLQIKVIKVKSEDKSKKFEYNRGDNLRRLFKKFHPNVYSFLKLGFSSIIFYYKLNKSNYFKKNQLNEMEMLMSDTNSKHCMETVART